MVEFHDLVTLNIIFVIFPFFPELIVANGLFVSNSRSFSFSDCINESNFFSRKMVIVVFYCKQPEDYVFMC